MHRCVEHLWYIVSKMLALDSNAWEPVDTGLTQQLSFSWTSGSELLAVGLAEVKACVEG